MTGKNSAAQTAAEAPDPKRILAVATGNDHKAQEIFEVLKPLIPTLERSQVKTLKQLGVDSPVEDGATFEANALIKARAVAQATGLLTVADDSGLVVDIMGAAPGIFSARWAGGHGDDKANMDLLLDQLQDVPDQNRAARFICSAALVDATGSSVTVEGALHGTIVRSPAGGGGFGYDPIFQPDGWTKTLAEAGVDQKNRVSHRAKAFRELAPKIEAALSS